MSFLALFVYIYAISQVSVVLEHEPSLKDAGRDRPFVLWLHIELAVFITVVASMILYLTLRALTQTAYKVTLIDERKQLPTVDALIVDGPISAQFVNFVMPLMVSAFLQRINKNLGGDLGHLTAQVFLICQSI